MADSSCGIGRDALLTATEAAAIMGLARPTVYLMLRRGDLEHVRYRRAVRITETSVRNWVTAHTVPAKAA